MCNCSCNNVHYSRNCNCSSCVEYRRDPINYDLYKRRLYKPDEYNPRKYARDNPYEERMDESKKVEEWGVLDPY